MKPEALREHYPPTSERARLKVLNRLDRHCRNFIALSPFLCLGTGSESGIDVSPRGDSPGFVHVMDDVTLAIPDWPGNNRLDSLSNVALNSSVGLLFLIPGVEETLRVNGTAAISTDTDLLVQWEVNGKQPRSALVVTVVEAFLHCGKALIRARLWQEDARINRREIPSLGRMLKDQIETSEAVEEVEAAIADAYKTRLY